MTNPWGWQPERSEGIWKYGPKWIKIPLAIMPWLSVLLLIFMMFFLSNVLTRSKGVLFALPEAENADITDNSLVALVMQKGRDVLIFFDDARYLLSDPISVASFSEHLSERVSRPDSRTLLLLIDKNVDCGDAAKIAACARRSGIEKLLFANQYSKPEEY